MRTRIKICGITRIEDAQAAARAGADAIGLVFDDRSPRFVSSEMAAAIVAALPPFVNVVGLFVDAPAERIRATLSRVPLDLLQFHGAEAAEACRAFGRPYIKAVRMAADVDVVAAARRYGDAAGILLDSDSPKVAGGSGETFDWSRVPRDFSRPLILAGGLTPDNVAQAIKAVRPYAVDVSSGVEVAKGVKDADRIDAFVHAVAAVS